MSKCECYATISKDDPRSEIWFKVCPDGHIPLKHPMLAKNKGFPGMLFYDGDTSRLTNNQLALLSELVSRKFGLNEEQVLRDLADGILPIRSNNVTISICSLHFRCMM